MKKVLIILLFLCTIGAGVFGTVYFYKQNQNQIEANLSLQQQNASIQAQLNTIGSMTVVYEVNGPVKSGSEILSSDLKEVSVPTSTLSTTSITDKSQLVGKYYKVNVGCGTILTSDLIMDEYNTSLERYQLDIPVSYFPVALIKGDYIDVRMTMPNGEVYVVMEHKKIQMIQEESKVITINASEEEYWVWQSALVDISTYGKNGVFMYVTKYLNPGTDTDIAAYYPIQNEMIELALINPNITDTSRIINETLRTHIDEVLFFSSTSDNGTITGAYKEIIEQHASVIHEGYTEYVEDHTDEEGNVIMDDGTIITPSGEIAGTTTPDMGQQVGDAMESIDQSVNDLGGLY